MKEQSQQTLRFDIRWLNDLINQYAFLKFSNAIDRDQRKKTHKNIELYY